MVLEDKILRNIEKPTRYTGGELNEVIKNKSNIDIRFAFCFPDVYEVGMSHLGMKILYDILNNREDTWCERVFSPWIDMEELMRANNIPLFALESKEPIKEFDIVGFTLQYEMSYTNILNMLDLAGIPLLSKDRKETDPIICAGGPCAVNPEILADFIDFFVIGESEEVINEVLDMYKNCKTKKEFLEKISNIEGIYVPVMVDELDSNGDVLLKQINKRIIKDLNTVSYPSKFIVPYLNIVHDRAMLEVFRGCIRGCRFCQAGYIYRPVREKSVDCLQEKAEDIIKNTGFEEMSLTSLSTSDYTDFTELTEILIEQNKANKVNFSLPSLRVDSIDMDLLKKVSAVRKAGLTIAPEAGTQRLRDVINKGVTEEDIFKACKLVFENGYNKVKLYFMIGLPTETYEDLDGIANLANSIVDIYYSIPKDKRFKGLNVVVSASTFVPKPFTPFQWCGQDSLETINEKQKYLREKLKHKNITYNYHDAKTSILEAAISRGDREIGKVILNAWKQGCKFDSWGEFFDFNKWVKAFEDEKIDMEKYTTRQRDLNEELPWDNINVFVNKEFLIKEYKKAIEEVVTPNCRAECAGCGINKLNGGACFAYN